MRLSILDLATPFPGMENLPRAGALITDWIGPFVADADVTVVNVGTGEALPALETFDALVLSGSEKSVYDGTDWIAPLRAFLLAARDAGKPMFGICFGHQIMADTFGGKAEQAGLGNIMGARRFMIEGVARDAHVWHQDQVTEVPACARVVGGADYCPAAVLRYDFPAMSVQFHPEYPADYLKGEIAMVAGSVVPEAQAEAAFASMAMAEVSPVLMAAEAAAVLRGQVSLVAAVA